MLEFTIPSMTCGHCVRVVSKALAHADPQAQVEIDLPNHQVLVETEKVRQTLVSALTEAGYPPR